VSAPSTPRRGSSPAQPPQPAQPAQPGPPAPAEGTSSPPDAAGAAGATGARGGGAIAAWWLPVALVVAVMAVLSAWGLARDNAMGNDEVASRYAAMLSLGQLFHLLSHVDAVHGLYYLLLHCWIAVGSTVTMIRIPSVIFMTAAAGLIVIVGRRLTGSAWAGLFVGLIMALDPVISYYAQTARSYAMVFCCVVAATLALVRALESEDEAGTSDALAPRRLRNRWIAYAALITLAGYLNELSLLVLAAHAVTVLLTRYGRRTVKHWFVSAAAGVILALPVIAASIKERAGDTGATRPHLHDIDILFHDYFGATTLVAVGMLALVLAVLPAAALPPVRIWRPRPAAGAQAASAWWKRGGLCLPSVAVPLLLLPSALLVVESLVGKALYADRYILYCEAGAALLAGAGVYRLGQWVGPPLGRRLAGWREQGGAAGWRTLVWLPGVLVCVCALVLQFGAQQRTRTPGSRQFDFGNPAFYIGEHARAGDGVLFFNTFYRKIRLGYPQDFRDITDFAMAISPQRSGTYNGFNKPLPVVRSLMLSYPRIWVVGRYPSAHVAAPAIRGESEQLMSSFTLVAKRHFKGMEVTLWLRR
jgi:mannosyltransferase